MILKIIEKTQYGEKFVLFAFKLLGPYKYAFSWFESKSES